MSEELSTRAEIRRAAKKYGWTEIESRDSSMVSFERRVDGHRQRINIWFTTGTVATALWHPKKGKTQLYRKDVSRSLLKRIFENPRVHTAMGYYTH